MFIGAVPLCLDCTENVLILLEMIQESAFYVIFILCSIFFFVQISTLAAAFVRIVEMVVKFS